MSTKAFFKKASPYQDDAMNLPVEDLRSGDSLLRNRHGI